jgi:16S rRNA (cytosine967-C5)-methyltransferase
LDAVLSDGRSADVALAGFETSPERAAVRAIALGTIRWYLRLAPAIASLLERPGAVSAPVQALLTVAAHQVEYSRNAPEATVHAAVDAARILNSTRATGFVNAVLRRFVRERATLFARLDQNPPARSPAVAHREAAGELARGVRGDPRGKQCPPADDLATGCFPDLA